MNILEFKLQREIIDPDYTLGRLYIANVHFGFICEDTDRGLEFSPGSKIHGKTCVPRGRYRLTATPSARFGRLMPLILNVAGFSGVRIHGGNTAADTEGCPLLGSVRTDNGVANCAERNVSLLKIITDTEAAGNQCWITIE